MDNKVSEKAIWEGSISPDNNSSITSQMQAQPQMMFCYKCNQVIPSNSTFCPYCQVKLFTECPKCGVKYSSQYPACNKCGTNRLEYLQIQKTEQERIERIKREERIRQEKLERERREVERKQKEADAERERQERLKRYEEQEDERKQEKAYKAKNEEIMATEEYKLLYTILFKAFEDYEKRANNIGCLLILLFVVIIMLTLFFVHPALGVILMIVLPIFSDNIIEEVKLKQCRKHFQKYISSNNKHNNHMVTPDLIDMVSYQGKASLPDCCIIAYRKKYGFTINYKWHNLK